MKHKFNVSPVVTQVAGWEAGRDPCRIGAPQREIEHRAAIYEIPITMLARASRKHMRVVAALTEKHGRGTGSRAGWLLILSQIACRDGAIIVPIITTRNKEEHSMMDVIVLGLAFGFFAHAIGYTHVRERL